MNGSRSKWPALFAKEHYEAGNIDRTDTDLASVTI